MKISTVLSDSPISQPCATHCPYCALQCGVHMGGSHEQATLIGNKAFPTNKGGLCIKGWTAPKTLNHPERLRTPLLRNSDGSFSPISWDEALDQIADTFRTIQTQYGRDAVGLFGGGSLTNEKAYLLGKFARVALGTAHIDYNVGEC